MAGVLAQNCGMAQNENEDSKRPGRPTGEVSAALLRAVQELVTPEQGPTLRELAGRACVGRLAAKNTAANMVRQGLLVVVRTRPVPYRTKPVAEYGIACADQDEDKGITGMASLVGAMSVWGAPIQFTGGSTAVAEIVHNPLNP